MIRLGDLDTLFRQIDHIVKTDPRHTPQLLALILAGNPFRTILTREDLLAKTTALARDYVHTARAVPSSARRTVPRSAPILPQHFKRA